MNRKPARTAAITRSPVRQCGEGGADRFLGGTLADGFDGPGPADVERCKPFTISSQEHARDLGAHPQVIGVAKTGSRGSGVVLGAIRCPSSSISLRQAVGAGWRTPRAPGTGGPHQFGPSSAYGTGWFPPSSANRSFSAWAMTSRSWGLG